MWCNLKQEKAPSWARWKPPPGWASDRCKGSEAGDTGYSQELQEGEWGGAEASLGNEAGAL